MAIMKIPTGAAIYSIPRLIPNVTAFNLLCDKKILYAFGRRIKHVAAMVMHDAFHRLRKHSRHHSHPNMNMASPAPGRAQKRNPHKHVSCQLFRPGEWMLEQVTCSYLCKKIHTHCGHQKNNNPFIQFVKFVIPFIDLVYKLFQYRSPPCIVLFNSYCLLS